MKINSQQEIKIISFKKNFVQTGEDKFILDIKFEDLSKLLFDLGWVCPHRNTLEKLKNTGCFQKEVDNKQIQLHIEQLEENKDYSSLICRDWWTKDCIDYFNLKQSRIK